MNFLVDKPGDEQEWMTRELGIHHRYFVESEGGEGSPPGSRVRTSRTRSRCNATATRTARSCTSAAYYLDSPDQLLRAATILADNDIEVEWGPGNHGTSGALFLYCFEPSGNRVEVLDRRLPHLRPRLGAHRVDPGKGELAYEFWGSAMPDTYLTYGTASHFTGLPARSTPTPG